MQCVDKTYLGGATTGESRRRDSVRAFPGAQVWRIVWRRNANDKKRLVKTSRRRLTDAEAEHDPRAETRRGRHVDDRNPTALAFAA